jgi:hypothetical protein
MLGNTNFGFSGGGSSTPPPSSTSWMLNGNTVGTEKYFGTNDDFSIPLYTNGKAIGILTKDGDFSIGTTIPLTRITSASNDYRAILSSIRFGSQVAAPSGLVGLKARGTDLSPLPIIQGDEISSFSGIGYHDGGSFGSTGDGNAIFYAAENFKSTNRGTSFKIGTTPIGTTSVVYNFGVDSEGNTSMGITSLNPSARLHIKGVDATSSNYALKVDNSASSPLLYVRNDGNIGIGETNPLTKLHVNGSLYNHGGRFGDVVVGYYPYVPGLSNEIQGNPLIFNYTNTFYAGVGTNSPTATFHIKGSGSTSATYALKVDNSASTPLFYVRNDGNVGIGTTNITNNLTLSTSSATASQFFINAGVNQGALSFLAFAQGNNQIFFDANYESSSLIAKSTTPSAIVHYLDNLRFNGNIGATIGASFSYNTLMSLNFTTGNLAVGLGISSALARIHNYGIDSTTKVNLRLEPVANVIEDTTGNTVNTTDATANVTAQTISVATNTVISIESTIVYRKTSGAGVGTTGDGTTIKLNSSVKNVGGTLTLDTVQNTYTGTTNSIAGVSATYTISGTNVLVSVTGVVNDNITWNVITKVNTVA